MKFSTETLESMSQAQWYNKWTLNKFKKFLHGKILEVGCGIGNFTGVLSSYGVVWALDRERKYLTKIARMSKKIKVGYGDIEKGEYFFKKEKFNSIVCLNVLEHIKNDPQALQNIYDLLEDGGKLILLVPAHQFLFGEIDRAIDHYRRYQKDALVNILERLNFHIISTRKLNFLGAVGWFIAGRILKRPVVDKGNIRIFNLIAPLFLYLENIFEPPFGTSILIIARKGEK